jgi:hypothetical protein
MRPPIVKASLSGELVPEFSLCLAAIRFCSTRASCRRRRSNCRISESTESSDIQLILPESMFF